MIIQIAYIIIFASSALSRHVIRYNDLDEDDQLLFRAAYDTPSYEHEEYQEDLPIGKLDLLKDGMWVLKAKINEMKMFNKALAANLLSTKLQVKELLENHMKTLLNHHHPEIEKKKPVYNYQAPPQQPTYPQYEKPQYGAHVPQHEPPHYDPPKPAPHHEVPQYQPPQYGATQYAYDPYYGH